MESLRVLQPARIMCTVLYTLYCCTSPGVMNYLNYSAVKCEALCTVFEKRNIGVHDLCAFTLNRHIFEKPYLQEGLQRILAGRASDWPPAAFYCPRFFFCGEAARGHF